MIFDRIKRGLLNTSTEEDQTSTHDKQSSTTSNLFVKAGNFLKSEIYDDIFKSNTQSAINTLKQSHPQQQKAFEHNIDQQILDTLTSENRQLKQELTEQQQQIEELKEKVDTLTFLEQEASEENEIMKFKVMSLEGQAAMEGVDMSDLKIIDELRQAKKEMHSELEVYKTQVQGFKVLLGQQVTQEENEQSEDPKIVLSQLKMLYDLHKQDWNDQDETKLLCSMYLKEKQVYRYYREKLFEKIAKKTLEQTEFLYKNMNGGDSALSSSQNSSTLEGMSQSRVFQENRKMRKENNGLQGDIKEMERKIERFLIQESKYEKYIGQLRERVAKVQSKFSDFQIDYLNLMQEHNENNQLLKDYIKPNSKLIINKILQFTKQQDLKVQQVNKQLYDRKKEIGDLFNQKNQLTVQVSDLQHRALDSEESSKLLYQTKKQIGDLYNENRELTRQVNDMRIANERSKEDVKSLKTQQQQSKSENFHYIQELQDQNQSLENDLKQLQQQLKIALLAQSSSHQGKDQGKLLQEKDRIIRELGETISKLEHNSKNDKQSPKLLKEQQLPTPANDVRQQYDKMLREKLGIKEEQVSQEVQEARKAVFEKNKVINEQANRLRELEEKTSQQEEELRKIHYDKMLKERLGIKQETVSKEVEEARKAVYEKNKLINQMANEQNDLKKRIAELEDQASGGQQQNTSRINQSVHVKQDSQHQESDFFGGFFSNLQKSIFGNEQQQLQQHQNNITSVHTLKTTSLSQQETHSMYQNPSTINKNIQNSSSDVKYDKVFENKGKSKEDKGRIQKVVLAEEDERDQLDFFNTISQPVKSKTNIKPEQHQNVIQFGVQKSETKPLDQKKQQTTIDFTRFTSQKKDVKKFTPQNSTPPNAFQDILKFGEEPPAQPKHQNLDFLNDMFSGLISNQTKNPIQQQLQSVKEEKKESVDIGWQQEDDIIIDEEEQLKINEQITESPKQDKQKEIMKEEEKKEQESNSGKGWGEEEDIILSDMENNAQNDIEEETFDLREESQEIKQIQEQHNINEKKDHGWGEDDGLILEGDQQQEEQQEQSNEYQQNNEKPHIVNSQYPLQYQK